MMREVNRNPQYYYQPVQQPIYYQPQQNMPPMNYGAFNRPYQQSQMPMQQNSMQNPFQMPNMYQMQQPMSSQMSQQPIQTQMSQQPTFYPPNRPFAQPLGGMGPSFPYPKQAQAQGQGKKNTSQTPNIFAQFKSADGNYDINKMINTAGTMVNTMNQITGMFKQVGGFFVK